MCRRSRVGGVERVSRYLRLDSCCLVARTCPRNCSASFWRETAGPDFLDIVWLKLDSFFVQVVLYVLVSFVLVITHPLGPSAGFLFHLEKGVDVGGEHGVGLGGKVPYFVHVLDDVPSL